MSKFILPSSSLSKKAFKVFRIRHLLYSLIVIALIIGGKKLWKDRILPENSPNSIQDIASPAENITAIQQEENPNKLEDDDEEEDNEEDEPITDNSTPWTILKSALPHHYSEPSARHKNPQVAIILTDVGLNKTWTDHILSSTNKNITLVFNPYSSNLKEQMQQAVDAGFQTLIGIPMEPYNYPNTDPGTYTLLTGVNAEENIQKLKILIDQIPAKSGIIGTYGSRFAASAKDLEPVLRFIKASEKSFIDHNPTLHSQIQSICKDINLPCVQIDRTLPNPNNLNNKEEFIKIMIQNAKENGMIVLSVPAIPAYTNQLQEWLDTFGKNDIKLVTIAELQRQQFAQEPSRDNQGTTNANQQDAHQPR
jgi:polysaccharide deacetylase 2 family uncharacterized protein YibQ